MSLRTVSERSRATIAQKDDFLRLRAICDRQMTHTGLLDLTASTRRSVVHQTVSCIKETITCSL